MNISVDRQYIKNKDFAIISLENDNNYTLRLLNYGATILELLVPDKNGNIENIVLTYDRLEDYINCSSYFGMTCGRTSGRISGGEFQIDGQKYLLRKNDNGINNIHGGAEGLSFKCWEFETLRAENYLEVTFYTYSFDGEEGFPGNIRAEVKYIFNNENEISISYRGVTDKATLLNLTNHSYFNLSGNYRRTIRDEELYINADKYIEINDQMIGTSIRAVKDTPMDFTLPKEIGRDIEDIYLMEHPSRGYDHPWILNPSKDNCPQIILRDNISGRSLGIKTTYPAVVVYTYNYPKNECLKGRSYGRENLGICFETQYEPNGINHPEMNSGVLYPGKKYYHETLYKLNL